MTGSTSAEYARALAAELRAERARIKKSIARVVEDTGLSKSAVLNYLNGKRDIPLTALAKLCAALDITPPELARRAEARLN